MFHFDVKDEIGRLKLLFGILGVNRKLLLAKLGIDYSRFGQVMGRHQALRAKEFIQIAAEFPEFEYWLLTGKELPEAGQISPMSKEIQSSGATDGLSNSRILSEMHETATGLHEAGLITKGRMNEFDNLCHKVINDFSPQKIKLLREQENISEAEMAAAMNVSESTIQLWEAGDSIPSGTSLKLLKIIESKGFGALL